jgi:hypothetical protein
MISEIHHRLRNSLDPNQIISGCRQYGQCSTAGTPDAQVPRRIAAIEIGRAFEAISLQEIA